VGTEGQPPDRGNTRKGIRKDWLTLDQDSSKNLKKKKSGQLRLFKILKDLGRQRGKFSESEAAPTVLVRKGANECFRVWGKEIHLEKREQEHKGGERIITRCKGGGPAQRKKKKLRANRVLMDCRRDVRTGSTDGATGKSEKGGVGIRKGRDRIT